MNDASDSRLERHHDIEVSITAWFSHAMPLKLIFFSCIGTNINIIKKGTYTVTIEVTTLFKKSDYTTRLTLASITRAYAWLRGMSLTMGAKGLL